MNRKHKEVLFVAVIVSLAFVTMTILGATLAAAEEPADLTIIQPEYVDGSVDVDRSGEHDIYRVQGARHLITLNNADHADVTGYGVSDGSGSLSYNNDADQYVYEPNGNGTATLYWTVRVEEEDGNTTTTTTERYEAVIQTEKTEWVHRTQEQDSELQHAASRYREIKNEVHHHFPDRDTDEVISSSLTKEIFFAAPFSTFFNDMRGVLLMMALRPGGWVIAAFFIGIAALGVASGARYKNRTQKQFRDVGDIEVEKTEAYLKKAQKILSETDYNEFLPDDAARAMRDLLGRNPWIGFKTYLLMRSPTHVKGTVLQMMAQIGYVGRVQHRADGSIKDAWVEKTGDSDGVETDGGAEVETIELSELRPENDAHVEFINELDGDALDFDVFQAVIDPDDVAFPISNRDADDAELLKALNPHFPGDFEDEEHLTRALGELISYVVNHEHTDDWGRSNREMDILAFLAEMDAVLADEADFPVGHVQRRMLVYIADNLDKEAEMTETVDRLEEDGVQ